MEAILTLGVIIGAVLLFDARARLKRLEARLIELERMPAAGRPHEARPAVPAQTASSPLGFGGGVGGGASPPSAAQTDSPNPSPEPQASEARREGLPAAEITPVDAPPPAPPSPASPSPASPRPPSISINFEELFGRRLPIWAGGITLAIAGVLIVKYAIDIGLFGRVFTPGVQAAFGLLFGFGLIGGAEWAHRQRDRVDDPRVAQALSGAGISTLYAVVLVAANAYHLVSPLTAFLGLALVTAGALFLSLRHGAPSALLGLAGGLAAPALTVGITAQVPLLAAYMAFTVAGLVGVARVQRWPWLALLALIGGAGWSLWLILMGEALTVVGSLSIGMYVVLLAVAAPLFAFEGARGAMLRSIAAVVGAAQLALLVATGGFEPLDWALFALIAAAGQWLSWRDDSLRVVSTLSAALSVLLLMIWPDPQSTRLLLVGGALAAIHAGPLLARLWRDPARVQRAAELSAIALAVPLVAIRHEWGHDATIALGAVAGAVLALAGAAMGWNATARREDSRFAWLVGTGGALLAIAALFAFPHAQSPLYAAAIAVAVMALARPAGDRRLELIGSAMVIAATLLLPATVRHLSELDALTQGSIAANGFRALRWAGVAAAAAFVCWRAERTALRDMGGFLAAALGYGAAAQLLPLSALPLVAPIGLLALAFPLRVASPDRLRGAASALVALIVAWSVVPLTAWAAEALMSLGGKPMLLTDPDLALAPILRRLLVPALAIGAGLWLARARLPRPATFSGLVLAGALGLVALHCLYRAGFAAAVGTDFVTTGLAQRLVWDALILGAGYALWKRGRGLLASHAAPLAVTLAALHLTIYSLLLHDPLWTAQHVGAVPLANLLLPLFAMLPLCLWLAGRMVPAIGRRGDALLQPVIMAMIALWAWASLRQAFHGTLLIEPGLSGTEDILRSILGIALALGYLLWGIRQHRRDWRVASLLPMLAAVIKVFVFDASGLEGLLRIGSFVALGFSLIGIGWLYSRQLSRERDGPVNANLTPAA